MKPFGCARQTGQRTAFLAPRSEQSRRPVERAQKAVADGASGALPQDDGRSAGVEPARQFDDSQSSVRQRRAPVDRQRAWRKAADTQWQASGDIRELARMLRGPQDRLASLREARQLVERDIEDQEGVRQGTETSPEKEKPDARGDELRDLYLLWARGLSSRQATLEFDARASRAVLHPHVKELAGKLTPIEHSMREAQTALRDRGTQPFGNRQGAGAARDGARQAPGGQGGTRSPYCRRGKGAGRSAGQFERHLGQGRTDHQGTKGRARQGG